MTATPTSRRSPPAAAAALIAVLLLFGALTFVAGLAVGGGGVPDRRGRSIGIGCAVRVRSVRRADADPTPTLETVTCAEPTEAFAVLCDAYAQIKGEYVDPISDEELIDGAVRGMVEFGLEDPYSGYLPPEQYVSALDDLSGRVQRHRRRGRHGEPRRSLTTSPPCTVVTAELRDGDRGAAGRLTGRGGGTARRRPRARDRRHLDRSASPSARWSSRCGARPAPTSRSTIERDGDEMDITITRAVIDLQEVDSRMLHDGIGYIRLTTFTDRATGLFREQLGSLLDQGATSIVFDLRGNPGGFITTAQGIASQFVPAGELLFTVESGEDVQRWESEPGGLAQTDAIPVVVLVDQGSASASEIVAGALKETGRATHRRRADLRQEHRPDLERPSERRRAAHHDRPLVHAAPQLGGARRHPAGRRGGVARGSGLR